MSHTPGPWTAEFEEKITIRAGSGYNTCLATMNHLRGRMGMGGRIPTAEVEHNARLIAASPEGLRAAEMAYLQLLQMPMDSLRLRSQPALCALRDFIASVTGKDPVEVQNDFEAQAAEGRG